MKRLWLKRALSWTLSVALMFSIPVTSLAAVDDLKTGGDTLEAVENPVDYTRIKNPKTKNKVTTWDCIWFGNYWQDTDSNGDGKVTQADIKDPIKWRVLNRDAQGNALLLADRLLEKSSFDEHEDEYFGENNNTWKNSTLRSFLNSYDSSHNTKRRDYSSGGFLKNAFSTEETNALKVSSLSNANPVYNTEGGGSTSDRVFCLSISDAINTSYGFLTKDWNEVSSEYVTTGADNTRLAFPTFYSGDDEYHNSMPAWWLRSPGADGSQVAYVSMNSSSDGKNGAVVASGTNGSKEVALHVRPAVFLNLSSSSALWSYAGTVSSDQRVREEIQIPSERIIKVESTTWLRPSFYPSRDSDGISGTWTSTDEDVVSVDNGIITGKALGSATVTYSLDNGWNEASCEVTVVPSGKIADPVIGSAVTTWDCITFGNFWQNTDSEDGDKEPIKWRVLDIDKNGDALLLSDKILAYVDSDSCEEEELIRWKNSPFRAYLNCYGKDYLQEGFLNKAFSENEKELITVSEVSDDTVTGLWDDGEQEVKVITQEKTEDKLFCLSLDEARKADYGFKSNDYILTNDFGIAYMTYPDPTRKANKTIFCTGDEEEEGAWCLRSPKKYEQESSNGCSTVSKTGRIFSKNMYESDQDENESAYASCVRPALRMNLSTPSSLWRYAGTVGSDGSVKNAVSVTGVSLSLSENKIYEGDSFTLTPVIEPKTATITTVTWDSTNQAAATVDDKGVVTGVKAGSAEIVVKTDDGGFEARCKVTVDAKPVQEVHVTGVTLPEKETVKTGKTITLTPVISPSDATNQKVTWKSSAENTATVNENGVVTGIKEGTATITVTTEDGNYEDTCVVTVEDEVQEVHVTGVTLPEKETVKTGKTITLTPVITPSDATNQKVTWKSSAENTATVNESGVVTGIKAGTAAITVKTDDGGLEATCQIEVVGEHTPIEPSLEEREFSMIPGEIRSLLIDSDDQYYVGVKWSYKENAKGTINLKDGVVTAKKAGTAEVKAEYGTSTIIYKITVEKERDSAGTVTDGKKTYKLSPTKSVTDTVGVSKKKKATVNIPAYFKEWTLSSNVLDKDVCEIGSVTFNNKGSKATVEITPKDSGATYIEWTMSKSGEQPVKAYTKVIVKKPVTKLEIGQGKILSMNVGEGQWLEVTGTEGTTDAKKLTFSVKGKGVKVSKSGYVVATAPEGNGTVTVKCGKVKETVEVKVSKAHEGSYITLNKISVNIKVPKPTAKKDSSITLKISVPKKDQPKVSWSVVNNPAGIAVTEKGVVTVGKSALPGCYEVKASPENDKYNEVCCEVIVQ